MLDSVRAGTARPRRSRVRGLSAMGMLVVLVVVVGLVTVTLKLAPHYIDFYTVQSVVERLPPQEVRTMTRANLHEMLEKRFKINNLRDFAIRDIINLERSRESTVLEIKYERREHLFFNVDVVLTFHKRYEYT